MNQLLPYLARTGAQGWNFGGPMLQDGNLILVIQILRWTNSGNLSQAFRRYGLGTTPITSGQLSLIIKIPYMI